MSLRILAGLALLCAVLPASAGTPGGVQVAQVQKLLGIDVAIDIAVSKAFREHGGADWTPAQHYCVAEQVRPTFGESFDASLRGLFETSENVDAWLAFGQTPTGRKVFEFIRRGVEATVRGEKAPDAAQLLGMLAPDEIRQVASFLSTPAGAVMQKPFPEPSVPEARLKALQAVVERTCAVRFDA